MGKTPTQKRSIILFWVFIIVVAVVYLFVSSQNSKRKRAEEEAHREELRAAVENILSSYEDSVEHTSVTGTEASVYVDKQKWDVTSEEARNEYMTEIATLVKSSMRTHKVDTYSLFFFTSDGEAITILHLKDQ